MESFQTVNNWSPWYCSGSWGLSRHAKCRLFSVVLILRPSAGPRGWLVTWMDDTTSGWSLLVAGHTYLWWQLLKLLWHSQSLNLISSRPMVKLLNHFPQPTKQWLSGHFSLCPIGWARVQPEVCLLQDSFSFSSFRVTPCEHSYSETASVFSLHQPLKGPCSGFFSPPSTGHVAIHVSQERSGRATTLVGDICDMGDGCLASCSPYSCSLLLPPGP